MKRSNRWKRLLLASCLAAGTAAWAAEAPQGAAKPEGSEKPKEAAKPQPKPKSELPTFTDPAQAGPDYADQGEYSNDWGGAQVIALGNGRFRLVIYQGGLPGAGWNGEARPPVEGKRDGDKIVFSNSETGFKHEVAGGELTTTSNTGDVYTMKKITRTSPTLGAKPPPGAVVLFDGTSEEAWAGGHMDARGFLQAGTLSKRSFTNFSLHVEFLTPFKPLGRGQDRGNSGVYLQDRYEIQVLDSFGLKGEDNECGGFYAAAKPQVNMCFPPLTWQTYDVEFEAAKFDASGKKTRNAIATVKHNGVVIHDKLELKVASGGGRNENAKGGPIQLQGHGNPVFYRNIWVVER
jgi:hypothetical protein